MNISLLSCNWQERPQQVADQTSDLKYGYWLSPKYHILGDSGGKVKILGDDTIGHCEKKVHMNTSILSGYRDTALWIYQYKSNGYIEKLLTVNSTTISCLDDKFVTIHNTCLNIPPSTSVRFAACEQTEYCSSELIFTFLYMGGGVQNAGKQFLKCSHLPFVNFPLHTTPQTKI